MIILQVKDVSFVSNTQSGIMNFAARAINVQIQYPMFDRKQSIFEREQAIFMIKCPMFRVEPSMFLSKCQMVMLEHDMFYGKQAMLEHK